MRILLVGTRVLPYRHGGDKNFWLDILHGLQRSGHEIDVLSFMVEDPNGYDFPVRRVPPIPVAFGTDERFNEEYRHLAATNNYASKTVSLPRLARAVRRRRIEFRPDVIHFMDNYGPGTVGMRIATGDVPTAISAPTYEPRSALYDPFLKASFTSFDAIVPFSEAYRRRLLELRVPDGRIRTIRWGVDVQKFVPTPPSDKEAARTELGIPPDRFVVLWTGFTQQTDEAALQASIRIAERVLAKDASRFLFLVCLKPEHFKESFRALERPGLRVFGTGDAFRAARASADVLLSPIQDRHSTAAPPLAWLECLAMGLPLVTTDIPGADEAAVAGRSGFTAHSEEEAAAHLEELAADDALHRRLQAGAREVAVERYSADRALAEYVDLWAHLAANRRR